MSSESFRNVWTITKRELVGYFNSPVAYVFIVVFLLVNGFFTFMLGGFFETGQANLDAFFRWHPWIYMIFVPVVGMRLWAEERRGGTFELLMTMPINPWEAVIGKFLAAWGVVIASLACTFPVVLTVSYLGDPDPGAIISGYVGSALLAAGYLALTEATSAMTRNQIVSLIIAVVACLFLILCGWEPVTKLLVNWAPDWLVNTVVGFSVMSHFADIQRGVLDLRDLLFFASAILFCLFSTSVILRGLRGA